MLPYRSLTSLRRHSLIFFLSTNKITTVVRVTALLLSNFFRFAIGSPTINHSMAIWRMTNREYSQSRKEVHLCPHVLLVAPFWPRHWLPVTAGRICCSNLAQLLTAALNDQVHVFLKKLTSWWHEYEVNAKRLTPSTMLIMTTSRLLSYLMCCFLMFRNCT